MITAESRRASYELAYEEAVRMLSQQERYLDTLGMRSGVLLSAAAIATSFLGGQALAENGLKRGAGSRLRCSSSLASSSS